MRTHEHEDADLVGVGVEGIAQLVVVGADAHHADGLAGALVMAARDGAEQQDDHAQAHRAMVPDRPGLVAAFFSRRAVRPGAASSLSSA
jgi:hypothetical protein